VGWEKLWRAFAANERAGFGGNMKTLLVALAAIGTAVSASADPILFENLLANASFEIGGGLGVCPTDWTCGTDANNGLSNSYAPTSLEYVPGSDGLPGISRSVPDGSKVASAPTGLSGSGFMYQTGLGTYVAGDTYALDLYVGTPLVVPSLTSQAAAPVDRITVYFLGTTVGGSLVQLGFANVTPSATAGQWTLQQFSFTPTDSAIGQNIGLEIFVGGGVNGHIADFDMAPVPESGTVALLGLGLLGLGALRCARPISAR
jgi:hypothetical protein